MSELSKDPEVIPIGFGSIEVRPMERRRVSRQPDGTMTQGDPYYVEAHVRITLPSEDGFFAFGLTPAQARALTASVDRHCPDADAGV
jgi:hypothetical protein